MNVLNVKHPPDDFSQRIKQNACNVQVTVQKREMLMVFLSKNAKKLQLIMNVDAQVIFIQKK